VTTLSTPPVRADITQFQGKDTLIRLIRQEYRQALDMAVATDEESWLAQTPCEMWQVRDIVGHLLDVSFGYLGYFKLAEHGWPTEEPRGMRAYGEGLGNSALAFRDVPKWEALARLDACNEMLFSYFDRLTEPEWAGKLIPHKWVGPVPAFLMGAFQLMDYSVHNWDLRVALGKEALVEQEAANTLVPLMFGLMQICFAPERAEQVDLTIGVRITSSENDVWTVRIADGQLTYAPGAPENPDATFSYPCHEFCLDVYQRLRGGQAQGDPAAIETFRRLFFTI
jgi:uncharacterized protein (TIGR03083 family)